MVRSPPSAGAPAAVDPEPPDPVLLPPPHALNVRPPIATVPTIVRLTSLLCTGTHSLIRVAGLLVPGSLVSRSLGTTSPQGQRLPPDVTRSLLQLFL